MNQDFRVTMWFYTMINAVQGRVMNRIIVIVVQDSVVNAYHVGRVRIKQVKVLK